MTSYVHHGMYQDDIDYSALIAQQAQMGVNDSKVNTKRVTKARKSKKFLSNHRHGQNAQKRGNKIKVLRK